MVVVSGIGVEVDLIRPGVVDAVVDLSLRIWHVNTAQCEGLRSANNPLSFKL